MYLVCMYSYLFLFYLTLFSVCIKLCIFILLIGSYVHLFDRMGTKGLVFVYFVIFLRWAPNDKLCNLLGPNIAFSLINKILLIIKYKLNILFQVLTTY